MAKPKTRTRNFERFQECITQNVESWNKTRLSPLEIYAMNKYIIWGIFNAALWLLSTDEYYALNEWSEETYGFSGHGVRGGSE